MKDIAILKLFFFSLGNYVFVESLYIFNSHKSLKSTQGNFVVGQGKCRELENKI